LPDKVPDNERSPPHGCPAGPTLTDGKALKKAAIAGVETATSRKSARQSRAKSCSNAPRDCVPLIAAKPMSV
jgi:hypothetical protein